MEVRVVSKRPAMLGRRRNLGKNGWQPGGPFGGNPDETRQVRANNHFRSLVLQPGCLIRRATSAEKKSVMARSRGACKQTCPLIRLPAPRVKRRLTVTSSLRGA